LVFVFTLGAGSLDARGPGERKGERVRKTETTREEFHQKRLEKLQKELDLTAEQKEKISKLLKDGWAKSEEEMKKMREQVRKFREETDKEIEKLLNSGQVKKFRQLREEMKERRQKNHKKHGK